MTRHLQPRENGCIVRGNGSSKISVKTEIILACRHGSMKLFHLWMDLISATQVSCFHLVRKIHYEEYFYHAKLFLFIAKFQTDVIKQYAVVTADEWDGRAKLLGVVFADRNRGCQRERKLLKLIKYSFK